jgi:filamentous hemagglutinin
MNSHIFKVIFNKRTGKMDVVSELTTAQGKAASESTGSWFGQLSFKPLTFALMLLAGNVVIAPVQAQVVADPSAPGSQRPTVLTTASGATQVNIQTPSAAGVSLNQFKQFDTQANGTVLNNSRTSAQTQTAGWVQANPWLAAGQARVIINQVNSVNPSLLQGTIEVAGGRSEVIIANPSGINVNGATFLNASRTTLTTGNPIINGGNLEGYRVSRGVINIDGQGLNTSDSDYTDILARSVKANAGIWAKTLSIVTGANLVNTTAGVTGSVAAEGAAPTTYAIDTAALGGMYGNKIYLVGTEAGLGVNNAGQIAASAGNVTIDVNGMLTNSGTINANGADSEVALSSAALINTGTVSSQGNNRIQTGQLTNSGTLAAGRELKATATDINNSNGIINGQRVELTANSLDNTKGTIAQTGSQSLALNAGTLSNTNGGLIGYEPLDAGTGSGGTSGGTSGGGSSTVDTPPTTATGGGTATVVQPAPVVLANGAINIAGLVNNDAGQISANGGVDLNATNGLTNSATLNLNKLNVTGDTLNNSGGVITTTQTDVTTNSIINTAGKLGSSGDVRLTTQNLTTARAKSPQVAA